MKVLKLKNYQHCW